MQPSATLPAKHSPTIEETPDCNHHEPAGTWYGSKICDQMIPIPFESRSG